MFKTKSLLLSVAAGELARHAPSGSVISLEELRSSAVSEDLASALWVVEAACAKSRTAIAVVVRPEIFTHGEALAWLRQRVPARSVHLCLSDGEAVRLLPGFANHVFFYRPGIARCMQALRDLRRRAPELLGSVGSQVNSAFCFDTPLAPNGAKPIVAVRSAGSHAHLFLPFIVSNGPIERDLEAALQHEPGPLEAGILPDRTSFVALSEMALRDPAFGRGLANAIVRALADPEQTLLIHLPQADAGGGGLAPRLEMLLTALRQHAPFMPSAPPRNILLHVQGDSALPQIPDGGQTKLVVHESFPLWQFTPAFYQAFDTVIQLRSQRSLPQMPDREGVVSKLSGRAWREVLLPAADERPLARWGW